MSDDRYGLFERYGVELEYMIVDEATLAVLPAADRLLAEASGEPAGDLEVGPTVWSNELVLHVLEMKTGQPATTLHGLTDIFQQSVTEANRRLGPSGALLLPGGMHPLMDPSREMKLWPHDHGDVYQTFDRIFDCRGHGWANLQASHLNLPFHNDDEFARLHAAIRVVLPILPALAASSPLQESRQTQRLDTRLAVYRSNAARVPSVSGQVVPEPVTGEDEYRRVILERIYRDLEPLDPEGVLREEWVNSRGAIARFDRGTIEIRVLDMQECPAADLAIAGAIVSVVRMLAEEATCPVRAMNAHPTDSLANMLELTVADGERAHLESRSYLDLFGWRRGAPCAVGALWSFLIERYLEDGPDRSAWERALEIILSQGCLARRILERTGPAPGRSAILAVYRELSLCLATGSQLRAR